MAARDILKVEVGAEGWYADITIEGMTTGGTYDFGLGANNDPDTGAPKLALTVTSLGFNDKGEVTTAQRTVYGTKQVRKPSPNQAENQETAEGENVIVRVALSDYVFEKDNAGEGKSGTAVAFTILAGLYTKGTASNAKSGTATNSSTAAYPKVIGNWSWPGYDKIGSTYKLRAVCFHRSAMQGKPVACVKFTSTDGTTTKEKVVTEASIDGSMEDQCPVIEYVATMDGSSFTQGAVVTSNLIAYPWIGDEAARLVSSEGTAQPTPLYGPIKHVADKEGTYAKSVAVVDPVGGNDETGAVTATFNPEAPPAAFKTIAAAYNAVRTYNNANYGRNNCGGSTIYLRTGDHTFMGGTPTVGTAPATWLTITRFPGDSGVKIAKAEGGKSAGLLLRIANIDVFSAQTASGVVSGGAGSALWIDRISSINCPENQPVFYVNTVWYTTRCKVDSLLRGLRPFGTVTASPALIRGNVLVDTGGQESAVYAYTVLGNEKTDTTKGLRLGDKITGQTIPKSDNTIVAFNSFTTTNATGAANLLRVEGSYTHGAAFIQNIIENTSSSTPSPILQVAEETATPADNVLVWHNVIVGQRANLAYDSSGETAHQRRYWSVKNNIFDDLNIKTDTFAPANGARTGNWGQLFGAGNSGNLAAEITGIGAPGDFLHEVLGLSSIQPSESSVASYPGFTDRKSYDGVEAGEGNGDYTLTAESPAIALARDWLLPYDLAGSARTGAESSSGAFAFAFATMLPTVALSRRNKIVNP